MNGDGKQIERVVGYLGAGGGVLAGAGHVVAAQDDEPVGPGAVLDGVRLAVVSDVAVLSDPVQTGQNALATSALKHEKLRNCYCERTGLTNLFRPFRAKKREE